MVIAADLTVLVLVNIKVLFSSNFLETSCLKLLRLSGSQRLKSQSEIKSRRQVATTVGYYKRFLQVFKHLKTIA